MDRKPEYDLENDQLLEKLLKEEPCYYLPDDFADNLTKKIEIHQAVKQNVIEFFTILSTVIGIIIAFGGTYYFLNKNNFMEWKSLLFNSYTPTIIAIALFIFFMDKVLLRTLNLFK